MTDTGSSRKRHNCRHKLLGPYLGGVSVRVAQQCRTQSIPLLCPRDEALLNLLLIPHIIPVGPIAFASFAHVRPFLRRAMTTSSVTSVRVIGLVY